MDLLDEDLPFNFSLLGPNLSDFQDLSFALSDMEETQSFFRTAIHYIDLYVIPLVALVGVVGNVLSFTVFICTFMRRLSSSIYLAALACADLGFLICVLVSWASHTGLNLYVQDGWCQTFMYLTYVSSFLSVWYVVSFTTERYIAVHFPLRRQGLCTTKRAKIIVSSLALFSLILYSFGIWTSGVLRIPPLPVMCGPLPQYYRLVNIAYNLDTVITLLLPFIAIFVMNVRIAFKVARFYKERKHMALRSNFSTRRRSESGSGCQIHYHVSVNRSALYTRTQVRVTKMLLTVSSIFLLLNLPHHSSRVYTFIMRLTDESYTPSDNYIAWEKLFKFLYYFQFSINLFLYSAFGKNFRRAFCHLVRRVKHSFGEILSRSYIWSSRKTAVRSTRAEITLRDYRHISIDSQYVWAMDDSGLSRQQLSLPNTAWCMNLAFNPSLEIPSSLTLFLTAVTRFGERLHTYEQDWWLFHCVPCYPCLTCNCLKFI